MIPKRVDHVVWATPDLEAGSAEIADRLGVEPSPGGAHPDWGTRNRLVSLGPRTYLEIIGPDPESDVPPALFGIAGLRAPRLVAWAAPAADLEAIRGRALEAGIPLGPVLSGSRRAPDGTELSWRLTDPLEVVADGIVPFFIDWEETPHPARSAAPGATLLSLEGEHPQADTVGRILSWLDLGGMRVRPGPVPRLIARVRTPGGEIELR